MLAFPSMLVPAAEKAGMKVPENADEFKREEYPHFSVFCTLQLGRRMDPGEHWENAKIIARIPEDKIKKMRIEDFIAAGIHIAT